MAMWPSLAVSARPSTGTVEDLPWAIFLRDTEGEPTRRYTLASWQRSSGDFWQRVSL